MNLQSDYLKRLAASKQRMEGRKPDQYRNINIETGFISNAEGSARVRIGDTEVVAGVKLSVGVPFPDKKDEGVLIVNAELSPICFEDFEPGPPRENAVELARVVDRGIREAETIDTKKLCIKEREKVWMVNIDISILNYSGNLIDACGLAALSAILNAKMPELQGDEIKREKMKKKLPVSHMPIPVTFNKIGEFMFLDANLDEDLNKDVCLTITTKEDGNIVAIQKSEAGVFSVEEVKEAAKVAIKKGEEIRKLVVS